MYLYSYCSFLKPVPRHALIISKYTNSVLSQVNNPKRSYCWILEVQFRDAITRKWLLYSEGHTTQRQTVANAIVVKSFDTQHVPFVLFKIKQTPLWGDKEEKSTATI